MSIGPGYGSPEELQAQLRYLQERCKAAEAQLEAGIRLARLIMTSYGNAQSEPRWEPQRLYDMAEAFLQGEVPVDRPYRYAIRCSENCPTEIHIESDKPIELRAPWYCQDHMKHAG